MKKIQVLLLVMAFPYMTFSQAGRPDVKQGRDQSEAVRSDTLPGKSRSKRTSIDTISNPAFVRTWQLIEDYSTMQDYHFDTLQNTYQEYNPVFRNSISNSYLGNIGLQSQNNLYFNNDTKADFFFLRPFQPYLYTPKNNVYYNITKPFTILEYSTSTGKKEEREEVFHAIHTQNINPFLNAGFNLRLLSSDGKYLNQKSKVTNFSFFVSRTGKDYTLHTSFHVNSTNSQENGGILSDSIFRNSNKDERTYEVNLEEADSRIRSLTYHLTQRYRFGRQERIPDSTSLTGYRKVRDRTSKTGSILHTLTYDRNNRLYIDPKSGDYGDFYPVYYIDTVQTYDSTYYRNMSNTVQLMLDENPNRKRDFGARIFITHDWVRYAHNTMNDTNFQGNDTVVINHKAYQYGNLHVGASFLHTVGTGWSWVLGGKMYLLGYKAGDLILYGNITRMIKGKRGESGISISGKISTEEPDHFLRHYESNHYQWNNDFRKTKDIRGSIVLSNEAISLTARADLSMVSDLIYYNDLALPAQHNPLVSIISIDVRKNFKLGPFHSDHQVHYQVNSNKDVMRIPDLAYYTSNYFAFPIVRNVLTAEVGFQLNYYTAYRGLAFAPSSGIFYNQEIREIGNYPYLDVFITAKLKRTRAFFRWDHAYAGQIEKNYFHVLNYPMPGRIFKFGFSWTFYN